MERSEDAEDQSVSSSASSLCLNLTSLSTDSHLLQMHDPPLLREW